jgi:alpha-1,2-mannosyltransferase
VLAGLAVLLTALVAVALGVLASGWEPPPVQDLRVYRDGAQRVLDSVALYPPGSRYAPDQPLPFTYPPFAALAFVPLALVPVGSATALWWFVTLLALGWLVHRAFAPLTDRWVPAVRWLIVVALTVLFVQILAPVFAVLGFGQVGMVLAAACLLDLDLAVRRPRASGVLVGLATAIKLTPAAFALTLLVAGRRRAVVVSAATCVGAWLLAALILPADSRDWLRVARDVERIGPVDGAVNVSWHGMWLRLLGESTATTILWLGFAAATLAIAAVRSGALLRAGHSLTAATVMGFAAVLASPVSWLHHAVWVVPLIGIVLDDGRSLRRWALCVAVAVVFSEPMTAWRNLAPGTAELAGVLDWFWVNTCVLLIAAVVVVLRPGPATRPLPEPAGARP